MRGIRVIVGLGLTAMVACGPSHSQEASDTKIVGGTKVASTDDIVKYTVALVTPSGDQFCTGTLITTQHVVTASHCVQDYNEGRMYVAFGPTAKPGYFATERLRYATSITAHERYSEAQMDADEATAPPYDIALLKLNAPAPTGYTPVSVLATNNPLTVGETLTLAGFGVTRWYATTSGILYKVDTRLTKIKTVANELEFGGTAGKSACMGDSGGPAFVTRNGKLVLTGVTSRGSSVCDGTGLYTDFRQYYDWIVAHL